MKKRYFILCINIILFSLLLFQGNVHSSTNEYLKTIRVAGDRNFPPFEYVSDDSGSYTGFNIDIMNALSLEMGMKIEFYPMPWEDALDALENGEVDAIQGMKYSEGRAQFYDFSDPYFTSAQGIFVLKENMLIHSIKDLEGLKIGVQSGDIANELLSQLEHTEILSTESHEEAIELLIQGEVHAYVGNRITGQYFIQKKGKQELIKIVGQSIDPTDYGMAVLPENKWILSELNWGIGEIKRNGTYEKIENKWFGEYITTSVPKLEQALFYLKIGFSVVFLIVIIVLWWNWLLKKEVSKRTYQIYLINKQLEEKMDHLQENLQFQKQLVESTYTSLATLDKQGNISMMNQKAITNLGLKVDVVGLHVTDTGITHFAPLKDIENALSVGGIVKHRESVWDQLSFDQYKSRTIIYDVIPIKMGTGEITGAIINFDDITEQKEMKKKVEQEDRLRSLGQVILGIAHEIRNPLMSLLTYTNLLPKKIDNPEFRHFFVEHVPSEIQRLNRLVTDLFDYALPRKPEPSTFAVDELIKSIIQFFKPKLQEKNIDVHFQSSATYAFADVYQIRQVVINVVMNAIESMDYKGELHIKVNDYEEEVVITIEDTGSGLDDNEIGEIFELFYSNKPTGTGLGLSISYQLMNENKGSIKVKSVKGSGTAMFIYLPKEGGSKHVQSGHN